MKETDFYKKYCIYCSQNEKNICLWGEEQSSAKETIDCLYPKMYPEKFKNIGGKK